MVSSRYYLKYEKLLGKLRLESLWLDAENRAAELRYNKNHDPNTGRFCSGNCLTADGKGDIISNELLNKAIQEGTISTKLDKRKQGAHIKGNSEYLSRISNGEHPSYITISKMETQQIINEYSGKGKVRIDGKRFKETVTADRMIGVYVEKYTGKEIPTNRGTIHYSKSGAHIVPSKPEK